MSHKSDLPSKICPVCNRSFTWRKRWERDWAQVKFCSDACRRGTPRGRALAPRTDDMVVPHGQSSA